MAGGFPYAPDPISELVQRMVQLEAEFARLNSVLIASNPTPVQAIEYRERKAFSTPDRAQGSVVLRQQTQGRGVCVFASDWLPVEGLTLVNGFCVLHVITDEAAAALQLEIYSELVGVNSGVEGALDESGALVYDGPNRYRFPVLGRDDSLADAIRYELWMRSNHPEPRVVTFELVGELVAGLQF